MRRLITALTVVFLAVLAAPCQTTPPPEPQATPAFATPEQQTAFDTAKQDFAAGRFSAAFAALRPLQEQLPGDIDLLRFTCEAALDSGDTAFPIAKLMPLTEAKPGQWQELMLLARAYAQARDLDRREATLSAITAAFNSGRHPKLSAINQFLIERVPLPDGRMDIYYVLSPYSRYNISMTAWLYNAAGQQRYHLTLETSDFDQPLWAKSHPQQAADGMRLYSLDGYSPPVAGPNGTRSQTHATFGFLDGKPSYETVRERWMGIATNKSGPMSTTSGIPLPAKP